MKKIISIVLFLISSSISFGAVGLGLQFGQGQFVIEPSQSTKNLPLSTAVMTTSKIENPYQLGIFAYIDVLPFIDFEIDAQAQWAEYQFDFNNPIEIGPYDFIWSNASVHLTAYRDALKLGIPFLAKAKLLYGAGYGLYQTTPLMTIDLMEQLLGGDLSADPTNLDQKEIVNFLEENTIENTGVHAQLSFQFKVLFIDTHVFYRHVFLDSDQELAPGISDFGSFNVRAGIGF